MPIIMLVHMLEEDDCAVYTNEVKGGKLAAQVILERGPGYVLIIAGLQTGLSGSRAACRPNKKN